MRFHTRTQLSEHIAETPEGFLICHDVPIARVGVMEYAPGDVPMDADGQSVIRIERSEEDVFAPEAVCSFEGKPLTVLHPKEDVTPVTWKGVAVGHAQNLRRGEGEFSDYLLADIVVTDERAISLVRGGLREISCGYDATYEQLGPGRGRQSNIRGNHIALVPKGRCGPRCRINDNREDPMSKDKNQKKASFADRLAEFFKRPEVRKAFDAAEEPESEAQPAPEQTDPASDADRLAALESKMNELAIEVRRIAELAAGTADEEETPPADPDEEQPAQPDVPSQDQAARPAPAPARDAATVDADTKRRAESMAPGLLVVDSDRRCSVQRVALRSAVKDAAVAKVVEGTLRGSTLDGCDCVTLDAAFIAASELVAAQNNNRTTDALTRASARDFGKPVTPAEINRRNAEFHKRGN